MSRVRSAIILMEDERVALIRRVNSKGVYHLFPGGGVEPGETPEEAALREAQEELGLEVEILGLAAIVEFEGKQQRYYWARRVGGAFGSGTGSELSSPMDSEAGSYAPVWVRRDQLTVHNVRPAELARRLASETLAMASEPLRIVEERRSGDDSVRL